MAWVGLTMVLKVESVHSDLRKPLSPHLFFFHLAICACVRACLYVLNYL